MMDEPRRVKLLRRLLACDDTLATSAYQVLVPKLKQALEAEERSLGYDTGETQEQRRARIERDSRYREGQTDLADALCAGELGVRSWGRIYRGTECRTLEEIAALSAHDFLRVKGFGRRSLAEVRWCLSLHGLRLKGEEKGKLILPGVPRA
jgi:hypothetical protein